MKWEGERLEGSRGREGLEWEGGGARRTEWAGLDKTVMVQHTAN